MPSSFTITAATNSVLLNGNRRAEASFTVYNASGQSKRGRAQIVPVQAESGAWYSIEGETEREFNIGGTSQYNVAIVVPSAAPAGSYSFRLNMVGVDNPDEDFTEGQAVTFQVPEPEKPRQIPWKIPAIVAVVLVVVIAAGVGLFAKACGGPVRVPDVAGSTVGEATAILEGAGLAVAGATTEESSESIAAGLVIKTDPESGSEIESGSEVVLIVSSGASLVVVPEVADTSVIDATRALTSAGFKVVSTTKDEFSSEVGAGMVIRAEPSDGGEFESGGEVILVISSGPEPLIVPEVAGLTVINATRTLTNAGFQVADTTRDETSRTVGAGLVIRAEPSEGSEFERGGEVILVISSGAATLTPRTFTPPTITPRTLIPRTLVIPRRTIVSAEPVAVHSRGQIDIPQTWLADLDEGVIGTGTDSDIWFQAATATERYVTPRNGARIARVSASPLSPEQCAAANLTTQQIDVNDLAANGVAVCVLTNQGRYSMFVTRSAVGPSPGTLAITYTTWERSP